MRFVWFLNFWGWSQETYRAGMLLRHPLEGIGGNWDEWFSSEVTAAERSEIETVGGSEDFQRQFWEWLGRVWIQEAVRNGNQLALIFVGEELARVAPFDQWTAFADRRVAIPDGVLSAVVLADESEGRAEDVRRVDSILLPMDPPAAGRLIVAEGFLAEATELKSSREAALQLLRGEAGWRLLGRWITTGRRPYPTWMQHLLTGGWLAVGFLIASLWFGPDPGEQLRVVAIVLLSLWVGLVLLALIVTGVHIFHARRAGLKAAAHLAHDQIRLRMPGRFTLKGGSAGLPFTLGILRAVGRAYPNCFRKSWLWHQFFSQFATPGVSWTATGVTTSSGLVQPVELTAKLRSCLRHGGISDIVTPVQSEAGAQAVNRLTAELAGGGELAALSPPRGSEPATSRQRLRVHRCRNSAQAVLAIARLRSARQTWVNLLALVLSGVMICAFPDLWNILRPPPPPAVIAPSSPSPFFLWVSLDTLSPHFFQVVLESAVWANRRSDVALRPSLPSSVRAEIRLTRLSQTTIRDLETGVVWIERRPCFLTRRFQPGEIVGRYTMNYINRLPHE